MIFTDVLILILSLVVSGRYEMVFRNAAFVLSIILLRFSLTEGHPLWRTTCLVCDGVWDIDTSGVQFPLEPSRYRLIPDDAVLSIRLPLSTKRSTMRLSPTVRARPSLHSRVVTA
jgi:hypothetical protein